MAKVPFYVFIIVLFLSFSTFAEEASEESSLVADESSSLEEGENTDEFSESFEENEGAEEDASVSEESDDEEEEIVEEGPSIFEKRYEKNLSKYNEIMQAPAGKALLRIAEGYKIVSVDDSTNWESADTANIEGVLLTPGVHTVHIRQEDALSDEEMVGFEVEQTGKARTYRFKAGESYVFMRFAARREVLEGHYRIEKYNPENPYHTGALGMDGFAYNRVLEDYSANNPYIYIPQEAVTNRVEQTSSSTNIYLVDEVSTNRYLSAEDKLLLFKYEKRVRVSRFGMVRNGIISAAFLSFGIASWVVGDRLVDKGDLIYSDYQGATSTSSAVDLYQDFMDNADNADLWYIFSESALVASGAFVVWFLVDFVMYRYYKAKANINAAINIRLFGEKEVDVAVRLRF